MPVTEQLREYTIAPGRMDEWLDVWRTAVIPLRRHFGFEVVAAWVVDAHATRAVDMDGVPEADRSVLAAGEQQRAENTAPAADRFIWVIRHDGDFSAAEREYYTSPDRDRFLAEAGVDMRQFTLAARTELVQPVALPGESR